MNTSTRRCAAARAGSSSKMRGPRTSSPPCASSPLAHTSAPWRVVAAGEALLPPSVTRRLIGLFVAQPSPPARPSSALAQLTERESEVVVLVAQGMSNAAIAQRLYISLFTAKTHVSRILTKLNARDRAQLVMQAYETGLVTPGN